MVTGKTTLTSADTQPQPIFLIFLPVFSFNCL